MMEKKFDVKIREDFPPARVEFLGIKGGEMHYRVDTKDIIKKIEKKKQQIKSWPNTGLTGIDWT